MVFEVAGNFEYTYTYNEIRSFSLYMYKMSCFTFSGMDDGKLKNGRYE